MPYDQTFFVIGSLVAAALVLLARPNDLLERKISIGKRLTLRSALTTLVIAASVLIMGIYIVENPRALNLGALFAAIIGGVFGSFGTKFAASLFGSEFGKRDPLMGAMVLLVLSVGYSLPLYSDAISELVSCWASRRLRRPS